MESKLCPGLIFAGEFLDIDGLTGGFNFQAAWTTGLSRARRWRPERSLIEDHMPFYFFLENAASKRRRSA